MKPVDAQENPGLSKLPTEVRNKMGYIKKGGLMKKPRRFEAGGEVEDDRTSKDQDIGDDVRARARKFLETGKKDEEAESPKAKSLKPKAAAPKAAASSSSSVSTFATAAMASLLTCPGTIARSDSAVTMFPCLTKFFAIDSMPVKILCSSDARFLDRSYSVSALLSTVGFTIGNSEASDHVHTIGFKSSTVFIFS
jgi:hypothetical protein